VRFGITRSSWADALLAGLDSPERGRDEKEVGIVRGAFTIDVMSVPGGRRRGPLESETAMYGE